MSKSFEEKIVIAKEILEKLQDPQITLSESVKAYEAGMQELKSAQKMIEDASLQVQQIKEKND